MSSVNVASRVIHCDRLLRGILFSIKIYFGDTLILQVNILMIKMCYFPGDITDASALTKSLIAIASTCTGW